MTLPAVIVWRGLQLSWQERENSLYAGRRKVVTAEVRPDGQRWLAQIILIDWVGREQCGNSPTEALDAAADWWEAQLAAIPRPDAGAYADTLPPTLGELVDFETQLCPACGLRCRRVELQLCPDCGHSWQLDPLGCSQLPEDG